MGFVFLLRLVIIITSNVSVFSMNFFYGFFRTLWTIHGLFGILSDSSTILKTRWILCSCLKFLTALLLVTWDSEMNQSKSESLRFLEFASFQQGIKRTFQLIYLTVLIFQQPKWRTEVFLFFFIIFVFFPLSFIIPILHHILWPV